MDRHEAADFTHSVDPELGLSVHSDTFDPIAIDAGAFVERLENEGIHVELFWE
ncbi:hypothetical protein SAMN05443661_10828 [Natronobacterium gregoryi]|uniref:Uncharacterized protein n=2 Tax=Natronobacterium gregoryi TaxID=44930 RepID=L9YHI1_NATGS|nr:hypothetical protein C490_02321 [Natronobacterium gregoryi SP2]SFI87647.1 hypothetical protein SAMN05443661_10828 [Natronobacterium gregoryi]